MITQENDAAYGDNLKDQGLNHLLQQESANQIMNLTLQDWHCRLLEEYKIEGDDYANWLQWASIKESKKFNGCYVNVPILNPMHLILKTCNKVFCL
jgi:hypothetical protein